MLSSTLGADRARFFSAFFLLFLRIKKRKNETPTVSGVYVRNNSLFMLIERNSTGGLTQVDA
jgi:hypothetical protein